MNHRVIRRRDFLAAAAASATFPVASRAADAVAVSPAPLHPRRDKITLEEHFVFDEALPTTFQPYGIPADVWQRIERRLQDVGERIELMDANGIAMQVVSLNANGIQGETSAARAIDHARRANDVLAERFLVPHPQRFAAFAAVALQDPAAAATEAERSIVRMGFKAVLVNGYTNVESSERGEYLDLPKFEPFWERVEALDVPVYLHPRAPLPSQRLIYEGHDELMGPMWAFGAETAAHALRLITSGLFDRHPRLQVILGHMGEGLVAMIARAQRRFEYANCGKLLRKPLSQYLRDHFHITTSGNFHTPTLQNVLAEMGVDRVLFSVDYPYENMAEGATWFDQCPLEEAARDAIAVGNARRLLKL
ncbi:MAG: hypothetical protein RL684_3160 [Pseudomonadota bacterium]|jgi:2,3-dihydroxybenzoate decarboxylase